MLPTPPETSLGEHLTDKGIPGPALAFALTRSRSRATQREPIARIWPVEITALTFGSWKVYVPATEEEASVEAATYAI
jgi:hypothetical protein